MLSEKRLNIPGARRSKDGFVPLWQLMATNKALMGSQLGEKVEYHKFLHQYATLRVKNPLLAIGKWGVNLNIL
ncbi:hypothetical protein [Pedosphaera parvula]|uniref:Uncharacterized protein n=1 Tax=Pedosphaera parvula (strain Ellin514) TaxID=320771 RepID=B9XEN9_PEDPL|nr:hypothetical protein [Pedosphaera parvula]EEF61753.1 hypothetical protein Cflav_PD4793 [Pedosphaera parvula Ellin514]